MKMEPRHQDSQFPRFDELFKKELKDEWTVKTPAMSEPIRIVPISTAGAYSIIHSCVKQLASEFKTIDIPLTSYHLAVVTAAQIRRKKLLEDVVYGENEAFLWSLEDVLFFKSNTEVMSENLKPIVDYIDHIGVFEVGGVKHMPGDRKVDSTLLPLVSCHYHTVWRTAHYRDELSRENEHLKPLVDELEEVLPRPNLNEAPNYEISKDYIDSLFSDCRRKLDEHSWKDFIGTIDFKAEGSVAQLVGSDKLDNGNIRCWSVEKMPLKSLAVGGLYGFGRVIASSHPPIYSREIAAVACEPFSPDNLIDRLVRMHRKH